MHIQMGIFIRERKEKISKLDAEKHKFQGYLQGYIPEEQ